MFQTRTKLSNSNLGQTSAAINLLSPIGGVVPVVILLSVCSVTTAKEELIQGSWINSGEDISLD